MSDVGPDTTVPPAHLPVLPQAVAQWLMPVAGAVLVDATVGRGGHAAMLLAALGPGGTLLALDTDPGNAAAAGERLTPLADAAQVRLLVHHGNFRDLDTIMRAYGLEKADGILADLGFASNQMDDAARGLSFNQDGPLDMRLDTTRGVTAAQLVNELAERELADLIFQLGEERLSRRIARKIVAQRAKSPITNTSMLARLARESYGPQGRRSRIDPATRTFMALRIAVNDELASLDKLLAIAHARLAPRGRLGIISFHSLEDRRVKHAFRDWATAGWGEVLTRKAVMADDQEIAANPRSRSGRLRVCERGEVGKQRTAV